ncbi:MAG TPA: ABC transporter substrate-binding protein [Gemmatimonadales bacterium]|nr:ABC transporter substrate-binding protein [Gemmatimonadales bacterium]
MPLTRRWTCFFSILPALLLLAGCGRSRSAPVRIGISGPFNDSVGAPMHRAAELAAAEINAAGGINGRPLELIYVSDYGEPDSAVNAAMELIDSGVVAVVGHVYSGATLASAPVYNSARVVQISPSSSSPLVSTAGEYTFRVCPSDLQQGEALARYAAERLSLRRGTILYLNDDYGRGMRQTFAREFSRLGGEIEEMDPYLGDTPDVASYIERLARRGSSQFVFFGGYRGEAVTALQTARGRGLKLPFLGGDALEGLESSGSLAEGTYISNAYMASFDTPRNREFVSAYQKRYPSASAPNQPAAATYDILFMLRDVLKQGTRRGSPLRAAIAAIGNSAPAFSGVTGDIAFDEVGDVPRQRVVIGRVEGGQVRAVEGL